MELPTYFPVSSSLLPSFERLRDNSTALDDLKATQLNILKAANTYFELLFPEDPNDQWNAEDSKNTEPIKELLDAFEKLTKAQEQTCVFNNTFNNSKRLMRERMRTEPELTLQNIDNYKSTSSDKKSFSELLEEGLAKAPPSNLANIKDQNYIFLKNATFVIDHPLDPVPDEEEDDDLEVEGGKIDLKCPISLNIFTEPMISKKCGHTFDKSSIQSHWKSHSEKCPILGCAKYILKTDFSPDRLMALRVKSFKAQERRLENAETYDRLD